MSDETDNPTFPIARATLKYGRDGVGSWIVEKCPYCGKKHYHGAGKKGVDDPRTLLGFRVPHCIGVPHNQYRLIEAVSEVVA